MNPKLYSHLVMGLLIALGAAPRANAQTVRYVRLGATGANNGTSWADAYTDLKYALTTETAPRDFWVASGLYVPGPNRADTFPLQAGDRLYAGFVGTESNLEERDWASNPTVLSGEIGTLAHGDNIFVIVTMTSGGPGWLDGFIVEYADRHAIHLVNSSPTLANLTLRYNVNQSSVGTGAALQLEDESRPIVQDCRFLQNAVSDGGRGGAVFMQDYLTNPNFLRCNFDFNAAVLGGAVAIVDLAKPTFSQCVFYANSVASDTEPTLGGALYLAEASAVILDTEFTGNEAVGGAPSRGGAIWADANGGEGLEARRCVFYRNSASTTDAEAAGGAAWAAGPAHFILCTFDFNGVSTGEPGLGGGTASNDGAKFVDCVYRFNYANGSAGPDSFGGAAFATAGTTEFVNCLLDGNSAKWGGGIACVAGDALVVNCTIARNEAWAAGGGVYMNNQGPNALVVNSILWRNCAEPPCTAYTEPDQVAGTFPITYSDIDGCQTLCGVNGNISDPPMFVDPDSGQPEGFRLQRCSKCIDAGSSPDTPEDVLDVNEDARTTCSNCASAGERTPGLDLGFRVVDSPYVADTGVSDISCPPCSDRTVDMGAFERYLPGDVNNDGRVNGLDIAVFTRCYIENYGGIPTGTCLHADLDEDGFLTSVDLDCLLSVLLTKQYFGCLGPCPQAGPRGIIDCNANEVPDPVDIAEGTSQDCNYNGRPDECDIASATSADVDGNGVPDECQPDCNGNSIPDSKDIADTTSADLNANGIPDECEPDCNANNIPDDMDVDPMDPDGNSQVSADCNANGVPDECEPDCNENGVPDDCDIDPLDPDGDEWVSPDCNENGMPDECDMAMGPPFGSYDCNENGIPDECDIADETSADCNENGIPDECDIAAEISEDTNENGIPDECEGEGLMGSGPSAPGGGDSVFDADAAWVEFYDWVAEQQWGPQSEAPMFEQFKRSVDKLRELGLLPAP